MKYYHKVVSAAEKRERDIFEIQFPRRLFVLFDDENWVRSKSAIAFYGLTVAASDEFKPALK